MSRKLVKNDVRGLDELALFRDTTTAANDTATTLPEADAAPEAADSHGVDAQTSSGVTHPEMGELDAALQSLEESAAPEPPTAAPRIRRRSDMAVAPSALHGLWNGLGILLCVAAIAMAMLAAMQPVQLVNLLAALARVGLSPTLLLGFGMLTLGVGTLLGRQLRQTENVMRLQATMHELLGIVDQVEVTTRALHTADESRAATALSGDEFGQVLFALQRNEEKLINLTRATKTFGKPLVEMNTQIADAAAQVAQSQVMIQALRVASENGLNRVEETLRQQGGSGSAAQTQELRGGLDEMRNALQGKLEGSMATHTQKLRDSLEGVSKDLGSRLAELAKSGREATVNLTPVQNAIAELRRDLANLNQGLSRSATTATPTPAAPALALATPAPAGDEPPPSGLASTIAGEHATKGANVLGAIAKLKKMRG